MDSWRSLTKKDSVKSARWNITFFLLYTCTGITNFITLNSFVCFRFLKIIFFTCLIFRYFIKMHMFSILLLGLAYVHTSEGLKKGECEVCIAVLDRFLRVPLFSTHYKIITVKSHWIVSVLFICFLMTISFQNLAVN